MKRQVFPITVSAGGAFDNSSTKQAAILGKLYAIFYKPGTLDTGADLTITCEGDGSKPLLTKTDAGTSNTWFYPRDLANKTEDGAALTGTAGGDRVQPILEGWIKVVVAQGGNALSGELIVYYE